MAGGRQQKATWAWNKARLEAANLLAADELIDAEVAAKVGIERTTLWKWKKRPEFAARVKELTDALGDVALRYAIGRRARRVAALDDRWERMKKVILERAKAREMEAAPGGTSGVLARTLKGVGSGEAARVVEEFEFDAALLRELREHEKQAAQELGQWTEKRDVDMKATVVNWDEMLERAEGPQAVGEVGRRLAELERGLAEGGGTAPAEGAT